MGKSAIFGVIFILSILSISGYALAQNIGQQPADVTYETKEYWTFNMFMDKSYYQQFGLANQSGNTSIYMTCDFTSPYSGTCKSIGYIDLFGGKGRMKDSNGDVRKCVIPIKFSMKLKPTAVNKGVGSTAVINGCEYIKGPNNCPIEFTGCSNRQIIFGLYTMGKGEVEYSKETITGLRQNANINVPSSIKGGKVIFEMFYEPTGETVDAVATWTAKKKASVPLVKSGEIYLASSKGF